MKTFKPCLLCAGATLLFVGCASPEHLQVDFGASYRAAFAAQADLDRPTAEGHDYPLTAQEVARIRANSAKSTADEGAILRLPISNPAAK